MDLSGFVVVGGALLSGGIAGFVGGLVSGWFSNYGQHVRIQSTEQQIQQLNNKIVSPKGVEVRQQKAEKMQEALTKALLLHKEGKTPEEILRILGPEYPDVIMDMVKKGLKGKLPGGLRGLF